MSFKKLSLLPEEDDDSSGTGVPPTTTELPPFKTWGSNESEIYEALPADTAHPDFHGGLASRLREADPGGTTNSWDHTRNFDDSDWGTSSDAPEESFLWLCACEEYQENGKKQEEEQGVTTAGKTVSDCFDDDDDSDQQGRKYYKILSDDDIGGFAERDESGRASAAQPDASFSLTSLDSDLDTSGINVRRTLPNSAEDRDDVGPKPYARVPDAVQPDGGPTFERTRRTPVLKKGLPASLCELGLTHPLRILLVDDNQIIQKSHKRQLQMLGYNCDVAGNGVEAVAMVAESEYDVLLLDLHMPEMDGFETAASLRETYPPEERPTLIAVTASSSPKESMRCLLLGIPYYLAKPLAIGELATLLTKCGPVIRPLKKKEESPPRKTIKSLQRKKSW